MRWWTGLALVVALMAAAPVKSASVNSGDMPDLPRPMQLRLAALLDRREGSMMAGGGRVDDKLGRLRAKLADLSVPPKERRAARARLDESRSLVRLLEQAGRCHRFWHATRSSWAVSCCLTGSMMDRHTPGADATAEGMGVATRLVVTFKAVGIASPRFPPVEGKHFLRVSAGRPLRARDADGAAMVAADDPAAARLRGQGWTRYRSSRAAPLVREVRTARVQVPPAGGTGKAAAAAAAGGGGGPPAVRLATETTVLPIGDAFEDQYLEADAGVPSEEYNCSAQLDSSDLCIYFCCNTIWVGTALCNDLSCF